MITMQEFQSVIAKLRADLEIDARPAIDYGRLIELIDDLIVLSNRTNPDIGPISETEKDELAYEALSKVGEIVDRLAGWAIHQIAGQTILEQASESRRCLSTPSQINSYYPIKELIGYGVKIGRLDAQRRFAARILDPIFTATPAKQLIGKHLSMALEALNFGEIQPILRAESKKSGERGAAYTLALAKLNALAHVHFRVGAGQTKVAALMAVSDVYGREQSTLDSWERRDLPKNLGSKYVDDVLFVVRHMGKLSCLSETAENGPLLLDDQNIYTDEQLHSDAKFFHSISKQSADWTES